MDKNPELPKTETKKRFQNVTLEQKEGLLYKRNKENTNKATKQWINCFKDFLFETGLPELDLLQPKDLPEILENFYSSVCKKPKDEPSESEEQGAVGGVSKGPDLPKRDTKYCYKNTTMKAIRAGLNRYFKEKFSIDIINNESFIRANALFSGVLQMNKEQGLGDIVSKSDISDADMEILRMRFNASLSGAPDPKLLQEIVIFYILYYMCRRGRENLRNMQKDTFAIGYDADEKRRFIYQSIGEADKNHTFKDTTKSKDGRIYEIPGEFPL